MPDEDPIADQAGLYVLGMLAPREKAEFEANLAASPELRELVRELETSCELLALAAPQRHAPRRVWSRIAAATRNDPRSLAVSEGSIADWLRRLWHSGWAMAACLALAWLAWGVFSRHDGEPEPKHRVSNSRSELASHQAPLPGPDLTDESLQARDDARPSSSEPSSATSTNTVQTPGPDDAEALQERLRQLTDHIAILTQLLDQQAALPAGAARVQVFRLESADHPSAGASEPEGEAMAAVAPDDSHRLEALLARALAQQLFASANTTRTPTGESDTGSRTADTPSAAPGPANAAVGADAPTAPATSKPPEVQVVELTPPDAGTARAPSASGSPTTVDQNPAAGIADESQPPTSALGIYSNDSGRGSIAFITTNLSGINAQLWALPPGGGGDTLSLGTFQIVSPSVVVNFRTAPGQLTAPGFMLTIEPEGGSPVPTGPVLVGPPGSIPPKSPP